MRDSTITNRYYGTIRESARLFFSPLSRRSRRKTLALSLMLVAALTGWRCIVVTFFRPSIRVAGVSRPLSTVHSNLESIRELHPREIRLLPDTEVRRILDTAAFVSTDMLDDFMLPKRTARARGLADLPTAIATLKRPDSNRSLPSIVWATASDMDIAGVAINAGRSPSTTQGGEEPPEHDILTQSDFFVLRKLLNGELPSKFLKNHPNFTCPESLNGVPLSPATRRLLDRLVRVLSAYDETLAPDGTLVIATSSLGARPSGIDLSRDISAILHRPVVVFGSDVTFYLGRLQADERVFEPWYNPPPFFGAPLPPAIEIFVGHRDR